MHDGTDSADTDNDELFARIVPLRRRGAKPSEPRSGDARPAGRTLRMGPAHRRATASPQGPAGFRTGHCIRSHAFCTHSQEAATRNCHRGRGCSGSHCVGFRPRRWRVPARVAWSLNPARRFLRDREHAAQRLGKLRAAAACLNRVRNRALGSAAESALQLDGAQSLLLQRDLGIRVTQPHKGLLEMLQMVI
jgi:hypothetical protein